ncbi:MBL fold metallo-hydrolase [Patescibacteria group bacterium]|nr:MBL fold metallo-hydrolase [Patescibacteria group bacterium]
MNVIWHGLGCFTFQTKGVTGEAALVIDPYDNAVGLRLPRTLQASIIALSHDGIMASNAQAVSGMAETSRPFIASHAGEYEVQGIFVTGIRAPRKDGLEHTIYKLIVEGIKIAYLGILDRPLTETEVGALGDIDILILPVGGGSVIDKKIAQDVVQQVEPRMVIPSHYEVPGLKEKLEDAEGFCKEMACPRDDQNKLKITKASLPQEDTQIVLLAKS